MSDFKIASADFTQVVDRVEDALQSAPWGVQPSVIELFSNTSELAPFVGMTSGFEESLRSAITELALQGNLTGELGDNRGDSGDAPFGISDEWEWVALGDIAPFDIGRTPATKNAKFWTEEGTGGTPWISIGDMPRRGVVERTSKAITEMAVSEVYGGREPIPIGSLLVSFKLSIGKTAVLGIPAFHNEAIASFQIDDPDLREYLMWAIPAMAVHGHSNPAVRGRTLNKKSLAALHVPLPPVESRDALMRAMRWASELLAELAGASVYSRNAAAHALRISARKRAFSHMEADAPVL